MIRRFKASTAFQQGGEYLPDSYPRLQIIEAASAGRIGHPNLGLDSINSRIAELNSVALAYWKSQ